MLDFPRLGGTPGRPKELPDAVYADRGYDSDATRELLRWLPVRWALCVLFIIAQLLSPTALARPHMLVWPLLAGWPLLLLHARDRGRAPHPAAALIMLAWVNYHASYIVGLGLASLFAAEAIVRQQYAPHEIRRWTIFLITSVACAFITPHGVQGFLYPFQVSGMNSLSLISEWRPTNFEEDKLFILAATIVWSVSILNWRKLDLVRIAILAGTTGMAILHARHQSMFAIAVPISIVSLLRKDRGEIARDQRVHLPWSICIATGVLALVAARMAVPQVIRVSGLRLDVSVRYSSPRGRGGKGGSSCWSWRSWAC